MRSYTTEDIRAALVETGVHPGDTVCVHSSLFMLGRLQGHPVSDTPHIVAKTLLDYLGASGTLVVPTFNFGFCEGQPYNRQQTASKNMGALSEYVRQLPQAIRSPHPMQSVAAVGPQATEICAVDTPSSFDAEGAFGTLIRLDAKEVLLGVNIQWASIIHYAEQQTAVPYRYWKTFTGIYIDEGKASERTYTMYVRDLPGGSRPRPELDFGVVGEALCELRALKEARLGGGTVTVGHIQDIVRVATQLLKEDPYCLMRNRDEVEPHHA